MNPIPNYNPAEHTPTLDDLCFTRRQFLERTGMGFGAMSLASILGGSQVFAPHAPAMATLANPLAPHEPHFPAKAKAVIHLFADGGPSHVDTWDPKPELAKYEDKSLPGMNGVAFPSPFKFVKSGNSGVEVSEVFPKLGECIDDICVVRSMWTDIPAHEVAQRFMNTGSLQLPKPSMGSWVLYGLGTKNQNMPGFISLADLHANSGLGRGRRTRRRHLRRRP